MFCLFLPNLVLPTKVSFRGFQISDWSSRIWPFVVKRFLLNNVSSPVSFIFQSHRCIWYRHFFQTVMHQYQKVFASGFAYLSLLWLQATKLGLVFFYLSALTSNKLLLTGSYFFLQPCTEGETKLLGKNWDWTRVLSLTTWRWLLKDVFRDKS